jgi:hypothetical protein
LISPQFHGQQTHSREKTKPSALSASAEEGTAAQKIEIVSKVGLQALRRQLPVLLPLRQFMGWSGVWARLWGD